MTWSYSGDPSKTTRDAVRFLIGDTDFADQKLSDEEIAYALTAYGSPHRTSARLARSLAARSTGRADRQVGDLRISWRDQAKAYLELADALDLLAASKARLQIYAGGTSVADKTAKEEDTDRVPTVAKVGMDDNPDVNPTIDGQSSQ